MKVTNFFRSSIEVGEKAFDEFRCTRLQNKTVDLFDTITKTRTAQKLLAVHKKVDIAKETVKFMRNIDYARLRNYSIKNLL